MTPIRTRTHSISKDYRSHPVTRVFVEKQSSMELTSCGDFLETMTRNDLLEKMKTAQHTLLLAVDSIASDALIDTIQDVANNGVRIYLLCGSGQSNHRAVDTLKGKCHVRTGVAQQGSLLLLDHATSEARGWMYSLCIPWLADETSLQCLLTASQIDVAFRSFAKLFWEYATEEGIAHDKLRKAKKSPTGHIQLNGSFHLPNELTKNLSQACQSLQQACIRTDAMAKLTTSATRSTMLIHSDVSPNHAISHLKGGSAVHLMDLEIPNVLIGEGDEAWLLPENPDDAKVNWCVRLSDTQRAQIHKVFEKVYQEPQWYWYDEIPIEQIGLDTRVRFASKLKEPSVCSEQLQETLSSYPMDTMDEFLNADPDSVSKDHTR